MKIAVVTAIPTPYRDPFWNEVAARPGIELDVYYCAGVQSDRPWSLSWELQFKAEILERAAWTRFAGIACHWNPALRSRLRDGDYDAVVVGGYNHPTMLAAVAWARKRGVPYYLMSEAYLAQPRSWWRRAIKRPLVRSVVRNATGWFPTGTLAAKYLEHYGASRKNMQCIANAPDVEGFWRAGRERIARRQALKTARGLGPNPVVLFAGRLVGFKQVELLLCAFQRVLREREATLVIAGDGPLRARLESLARQRRIARSVRFLGFLDPADLPDWYAMADLFVLPSSDETWGVVVLEALASGIPVVITDHVGCHADVLNHPDVGETVPALAESELAAAMARRLRTPVDREEIGRRWAPLREQFRYPVLADRFHAVLQPRVERGTRLEALHARL